MFAIFNNPKNLTDTEIETLVASVTAKTPRKIERYIQPNQIIVTFDYPLESSEMLTLKPLLSIMPQPTDWQAKWRAASTTAQKLDVIAERLGLK